MRAAAPALLLLAVLGDAAASASGAATGGAPVLMVEPPARAVFSNSSGAAVPCAARAQPPPRVTWLAEDGVPLSDIPGLRQVLPNGTLWLPPFAPSQYRADVHAAVVRCRVAAAVGALLSRDCRLQAVMDTEWEPRVEPLPAAAGGAAALACALPAAARDHAAVTAWLKDGVELSPGQEDAGEGYVVGGGRGQLLVVGAARAAAGGSFACVARHRLTGQLRRSAPVHLQLTASMGSMAPRIVLVSEEESVQEGEDVRLVCAAVGNPPPTYSWFRETLGRSRAVASGLRVSVWGGVLALRRARAADAGAWTCRAHNALGEQRRAAVLRVRVPLAVTVEPQVQVANSGSTVTFNCSVSEGARVRWLHDGAPVGGAERTLSLRGVARAHRGVYQCVAERDLDTAQAAAELRLGDTAPELVYTFIEQALHPGPALALQCAAAGAPPPRFTWLLDNQPIDEHNTAERTITQFLSPSSGGEVVSFLNMSAVRASDGGRYSCRAANSRGVAQHSARLNVYGPPSIRNGGPVRVVAGANTTVYCPYSGFPISEIRWSRGGLPVGGGGRLAGGAGGELLLWPAEPADAGVYTCRVTAPSGQYAQKDIQIFVRNPPKISGFSFPTDLIEGSSVQVLCGITSGDKPVYFSWLKDGQHIPSTLQVQEKSLDEFSFLIFSHVTSQHSGEYTCVATNPAAEVNHTARLAVKVAPTWIYEPQDVSALLGTQILAHCSTKGYPEPKITWLKGHGTGVNDFRSVSNLDLQFSVLPNGSLSISPAAHHHEGQYMCRAENGIGRGLSKIIAVSVNEPAHFEYSSRNMTVKRTAQASLQCDARGDPPIQIQWSHNMKRVDLSTYRISMSEKRSESGVSSQLSISHAERLDSGVYRCRAENTYGRDELLIYLAVQEFPEAPKGLHVSKREARGAVIAWRRGYDGNARVRVYRLQYRVVGDRHIADRDDWTLAPTRDVPADRIHEREELTEQGPEVTLEYKVDGLRPATAYALRLSAVNAIGDSDYSDPVIVQTLEEAPSETPHNVQVQATAPGELLVKWQAPPQDSWNGELLGYVVSWRAVGGAEPWQAVSAAGWGAARATVSALRPHAHYELRVQAFNAVGAGPPSPTLTATTLEGVPEAPPERVRCEPLSAQSVRVWWEPPPAAARGGVLLGYDIIIETVGQLDSVAETRRSGGLEAVLGSLRRAANHSLCVRAATAAGAGPASEPVYCATHEDIPGPPADIKALANSEDSVIVSWLAPVQRNGRIKHYTVYSRPQRSGQQSQLVIPAGPALPGLGGDEQLAEVRGLRAQPYEFWVTAATAAGEGEMSAVVARKPNGRAPAKMASFGRRVVSAAGARLRLPCAAAGAPAPRREWARRGEPLHHDPRFAIEGHYLVIHNLDRTLSDNYTCTVRNPWGEESARWEAFAVSAPAAPALRPPAANAASLALRWDDPPNRPYQPVHGYTVQWRRAESPGWQSLRLDGGARAHALRRLACGAPYRVRLRARNAVGESPPSEELLVSTKGGLSKPAAEKDLITANSTCVRLNLLTWDSNGCPVTQFLVSMRSIQESAWRSQTVAPGTQPLVICGLLAAAWYQLKVVATSSAGTTPANYYFSTLTEGGERIPAPASFPPDGESQGEHSTAILASTGCALVAALLLLATLAWRRRKGYEQGDICEPEEKSVEKRDNRRNCQQVYTSSPIKHGKKDQQEMYEISPYATFSMAGGATGAGGASAAESSGTLRTFGRAEPPPLAAAPPRGKHRSPSNSDEYTLSRAMTLSVRREHSDSESSGSPCADCAGPYRMPQPPGKEEVFRAVTDSSAESAAEARPGSAHSLAPYAHSPHAVQAAHAAHAAHAGRHDKARRRPRRHHTPTSSRYQQRQEQERRDFTIHV